MRWEKENFDAIGSAVIRFLIVRRLQPIIGFMITFLQSGVVRYVLLRNDQRIKVSMR